MKQPNIVLLICHDLGDVIGPYGYTDQETSRLNALAAQSMTFKRHFVTSPGCSPSRAAMATGRYPHSNGMFGLAHLGWSMHPGEVTIAAVKSGDTFSRIAQRHGLTLEELRSANPMNGISESCPLSALS